VPAHEPQWIGSDVVADDNADDPIVGNQQLAAFLFVPPVNFGRIHRPGF